jgi:hypothetical protein
MRRWTSALNSISCSERMLEVGWNDQAAKTVGGGPEQRLRTSKAPGFYGVHLDTLDCVFRFGGRWRSEATAGLLALGLDPPADFDMP